MRSVAVPQHPWTRSLCAAPTNCPSPHATCHLPGGVYSWSDCGSSSGGGGEGAGGGSGSGGEFAPLLEASALCSGSCESIALAEGASGAPLLCASFRSKLAPAAGPAPLSQAGRQAAAHMLFELAAPGEDSAVRRAGPGPTAELAGHASCRVVTAGAFAHLPGAGVASAGALAFFSGDEAANTVAAWDCATGAPLRRRPWPSLEGPVLQLAAAAPQGGGGAAPLVGALSSSQLVLCEWVPEPLF
jgi:hypothetical protein